MDHERRTQGERTAATTSLLIGAAIDSLIDVGWAGTTAVEVCQRAGVTRGALMHHFDGLPGLLAAALEQVHRDLTATGSTDLTTLAGMVDATWERIGSRRFKAVLEAWFAMANDPALRAGLGPVIARFGKLVDPIELRADHPLDGTSTTFFLMARETMLGLALGRASSSGRPLPHEASVIDLLRRQATELDLAR